VRENSNAKWLLIWLWLILLIDYDTIFSFEVINAKELTESLCPVNVAIGWNEIEFYTIIAVSYTPPPDTIFSFEGINAKDVILINFTLLLLDMIWSWDYIFIWRYHC